MNNRIDSYLSARLDPYAVRPGSRPAAREVQPPTASPARPAAARPADGLSAAEQQRIDRYFPPSEAMTLRVYGARGGTDAIQPGGLGGRLDISG